MENKTELKETWKEAKARLKQKLSGLIDDDVLLFEARHDKLLKRLQSLGKSREEIRRLIFKKH